MWDYRYSQASDKSDQRDLLYEPPKMLGAPQITRSLCLDNVLPSSPNPQSYDPRSYANARFESTRTPEMHHSMYSDSPLIHHPTYPSTNQPCKQPFLIPEQSQKTMLMPPYAPLLRSNSYNSQEQVQPFSQPLPQSFHQPPPPPLPHFGGLLPPCDIAPQQRPQDPSCRWSEWTTWNSPEWAWGTAMQQTSPLPPWCNAPAPLTNGIPLHFGNNNAPPVPIAPPRWSNVDNSWGQATTTAGTPRPSSPLWSSERGRAFSPQRTSATWTDAGPLPMFPSRDSRWTNQERTPSPVPRAPRALSVATPAPNSPRCVSDVTREATQRYETAINRCAKERQWQKAVKILREMINSSVCGPTVRAYTSAISACAKVGQSQKALELLEEMRGNGVEPNVLTYSAAISACEKSRKCKLALSLLQEMKKHHIEPDVISYNAAISACEKARKWRLALMLIQEMREEAGVSPDVISYSAAISACEKGGKLNHALQLLQEMKDQGVRPDVILYNATISACDKRGAWRQAVDLLREMRANDVEPDVISYSTAISACNRGGEADHAVLLLHEMRDQNVEPNGMAFVSAISAFAKRNMYPECVQLLHEMKELGFKYEEGGEWKKALSVVRKMTDGGKDLEEFL